MSLERQDVRFKLDAVVHGQLRAICDSDGVDINDFVEKIVVPVVKKRVHDAIELANRLHKAGLIGKTGEFRE